MMTESNMSPRGAADKGGGPMADAPIPTISGGQIGNGRPLVSQQSSVWSRRQQAVCVRHAFKHYGSNKNPNHVLQNLNMTVAKGTM